VPVETVTGLVNCGDASGIAAVLASEVPDASAVSDLDEEAASVVAIGADAVVVAVAAVVFASVVVVAALVVIVFAVVNVNPIATGVIAFSATFVGADAVVVTPSSNAAATVAVVPDVIVVAVVVTHVPVCRVVVVTTGASVLFDVASYAANFIEFMVSSLSTDTLSLEGKILAS